MNRAKHPGTAFTLVEVLVSVTVLILIVLVAAQLMNGATGVTLNSNKHMDADGQARLVFDRMAADLGSLVKRSDVEYYFGKNGANTKNDQMAFYCEASGYYPAGATGSTPKSSVSVIGYRIKDNQLERLNKALIWSGVTSATSGASGLANPAPSPMIYNRKLTDIWSQIAGAGADADYQVLGEQVYRLEFCFLLKDNTFSDQPWLQTSTSADGLKDVVALVMTIAILDKRSRLLATPDDIAASIDNLDDVSGPAITKLPAQLWQDKVNSGGQTMPRIAAGQVRIYQRYFYLNPTPAK